MSETTLNFCPFRAWRYSTSQVELSRVIAPPYDVISEKEREVLYARSPFNVVRLILGKEPDFYDSARRFWEAWREKGLLIQDNTPSFYLYEQVFRHPIDLRPVRRLALIGILNLEGDERVLRHEATFEGPRRDRLRLLEKTRTNLSPIFGLYRDSGGVLNKIFSAYRKLPPLFQAREDSGDLHQGWAVECKEEQKTIQKVIAPEKILIADGHHRFETAVEYRKRMRQRFPQTPSGAPFDFVMMALVAFDDEGLVMLPTHRLLRSFGSLSKEAFLEKLSPYFDLLPTPERRLFPDLHQRPRSEKVFGGIFGKDQSFLLRLKKDPESLPAPLSQGKPLFRYETEAHLLTHFIFDTLWRISGEERQNLVEYTHSWKEAVQAVREGKYAAVFLLRSEEIETIRKLAEGGVTVPQKTTYFYPKLASGLFFYHHGEA